MAGNENDPRDGGALHGVEGAETEASRIRERAQAEAVAIVRAAEASAAARIDELTREARRIREDAQRESRETVQEAEAQAEERRRDMERTIEEMESAMENRLRELDDEIRRLADLRGEASDAVSEVVTMIHGVADDLSRKLETLPDAGITVEGVAPPTSAREPQTGNDRSKATFRRRRR